jgi:hypothetical protein
MLALSAARAAAAAADAGLACISVSVLVLISIRFLFFCLSFNFAFHRQLLHPPNEPPPVYVSALLSRKTRRLFAFCEQPLPRARLVIDCSKTKSSPIKKAQRFFRRFRRRRGHTPVFPQLQTIPGLIRRVAWRAALGFRLRGTHWGKVMRCLDQSIPGSRTASLMCVCELPFPARQARTSELIVDAEGRRLLSWKFATNFSENSDRIAFRLSALPFEFRQLFHFSNSQIVPKLIRNFPKISSRSPRHLKLFIFNFLYTYVASGTSITKPWTPIKTETTRNCINPHPFHSSHNGTISCFSKRSNRNFCSYGLHSLMRCWAKLIEMLLSHQQMTLRRCEI